MNASLGPQELAIRRKSGSRTAIAMMDDALIQELIQCGFRIEKLACTRGRSLRQLERDFHGQCGCCPREVIHETRMKRALDRLNSSARVKEIADELGYSDPAHFSRAFRQFFGSTPLQVRRKLLKKSPRNASMSPLGKKMSQNGK